jgi:hypothetical protein
LHDISLSYKKISKTIHFMATIHLTSLAAGRILSTRSPNPLRPPLLVERLPHKLMPASGKQHNAYQAKRFSSSKESSKDETENPSSTYLGCPSDTR